MNIAEFDKISICLDMGGCPNRCKHCWIGASANGNMSVDDLKFAAHQFEKYTSTLEVYSWYREPDFKDNYQELWELENQLSKNTKPKRFDLLSFWRLNRDQEYVKWAYDLGVRRCQLTFFGLKEKTDYYVGRPNAFDELLNATKILLENKIAPHWQIFVFKDNIDEIEALIELSKEFELAKRCQSFGEEFRLFIHQGTCDSKNTKLYENRITELDKKRLPSEYCLDLGITEQELCKELSNDHSLKNFVTLHPVFYIDKDFNVYQNHSELSEFWYLGNLLNDGVHQILTNYLENNSLAQHLSLTIPISEMVSSYGEPKSMRLFEKEDYLMYLLHQCCTRMIKYK